MSYRLLKHKGYDESIRRLPKTIQHKATWAQVLLGMRGRTPSVKGTRGLNARWRRTPVQGNHYYMWWIPHSESYIADSALGVAETNTILIHSIRHHDETDVPIDTGTLADYEEVSVGLLDPRYEEQYELSQRVNREHFALSTIKGLPGSGKTVSLFYLVKDLARRTDIHRILYITYTNRLKRAAREFLLAQGEAVNQAVTIRTLAEIEHELTNLPAQRDLSSGKREFARYVELQNATALGPWKKYPQALYTEVRAHLLGKSFPPDYTLPAGCLNDLLLREGVQDAVSYATARDLELPLARLACNFAERSHIRRYFQDQWAAQRALELLQRGRHPGWLADLDALVVDEVQDLTVVQIALLGELVRTRLRRRPQAPFIFTVAGDESQIVQPSGFDWGFTKDLLGEQLGVWPVEFEYYYQRRAPRNLAQLIDNTWRLYGYLPKGQRPSARRQAFTYEAEDEQDDLMQADRMQQGRILLCAHPPILAQQRQLEPSWKALISELADKPGRILIDLTETVHTMLAGALGSASNEVIFLAREIKGLERATVVIYGLNTVYERAMRLCETHEDGNIPRFEARRLFDEIRVALSRSTEKIILLEPAEAPVLDELGVPQLPGTGTVAWDVLVETLQTEDLSDIEVIEGYLDEVDDLFERGMWEPGYRRNRRAFDLAMEIGDAALQRETQEQFIRGYVQQAAGLLLENAWEESFRCNRQANDLAQQFGDLVLIDEVEDQFHQLVGIVAGQIQQQLQQAAELGQRRQYSAGYAVVMAAQRLSSLVQEASLSTRVDEALVASAWAWAADLAGRPYTVEEASQIAGLLAQATAAMERQADGDGSKAMQVLADRYLAVPQREHLSVEEVAFLLESTEQYLRLVQPLHGTVEAYVFVERWIDEIFHSLDFNSELYARWMIAAQEYAAHVPTADFDEEFWDLENRLNLLLAQGKRGADDPEVVRFRALVASYNGDAQAASQTWEQLGEFAVAAEYARTAGDLERAFRLFHMAKVDVPEALGTVVQAVRRLQQLRTKHTGLRQAERRALLRELDALRAAVSAADAFDEEQIVPEQE